MKKWYPYGVLSIESVSIFTFCSLQKHRNTHLQGSKLLHIQFNENIGFFTSVHQHSVEPNISGTCLPCVGNSESNVNLSMEEPFDAMSTTPLIHVALLNIDGGNLKDNINQLLMKL